MERLDLKYTCSGESKAHYAKIRAHLKTVNVHPLTRGFVLGLLKVENRIRERFNAQIKEAGSIGICTAVVMPREERRKGDRPAETIEGHICKQPVFQRGFCTNHFVTHVLHLPERRHNLKGFGATCRPFRASSIPCGRLSEKQIDLMSDLERLPMATPLEECLERLNKVDPRNILPELTPNRGNSMA